MSVLKISMFTIMAVAFCIPRFSVAADHFHEAETLLEEAHDEFHDLSWDLPFGEITIKDQKKAIRSQFRAAVETIEDVAHSLHHEPKNVTPLVTSLHSALMKLETVIWLLPIYLVPDSERPALIAKYREGLACVREAVALLLKGPTIIKPPPGVWQDSKTGLWWKDGGVKTWTEAGKNCLQNGTGWQLASSFELLHAYDGLLNNKVINLPSGTVLYVRNPHEQHAQYPYPYIQFKPGATLNATSTATAVKRSLCVFAKDVKTGAWQDPDTSYWWKDLGSLTWTEAKKQCVALGQGWQMAASYELLPTYPRMTDVKINTRFTIATNTRIHVRDPHAQHASYPYSYINFSPGQALNASSVDKPQRTLCIGAVNR